LIFALLELYGVDTEGEQGQLKLYALWAGAGFADAAKSVGLRAGATAVGRVLRGSLPGRIIRRLNPVLWKAILRRLGLEWLPRAAKSGGAGSPDRVRARSRRAPGAGDATLATLDDAARARRRARPTVRRTGRRTIRIRAADRLALGG